MRLKHHFFILDDSDLDLVLFKKVVEHINAKFESPLVSFEHAKSVTEFKKSFLLKKFDFYLFDLFLEDTKSLALISELKSFDQTADIPVVVMSSSDYEKDIVDAYEAGADDYSMKPFDVDSLSSLVFRTLQRYSSLEI